jgi:hypothetical protein
VESKSRCLAIHRNAIGFVVKPVAKVHVGRKFCLQNAAEDKDPDEGLWLKTNFRLPFWSCKEAENLFREFDISSSRKSMTKRWIYILDTADSRFPLDYVLKSSRRNVKDY